MAELIGVWWFDICGIIDMADLSPKTMYAVRFLIRHTPTHSGWGILPAVLSLQLEDDPHIHEQRVFLCPKQKGSALRPSKEYKGWMYVKVGEFLCDADGGEVAFRMQEVNEYKQGIIVMGVEIRPCSDEGYRRAETKGKIAMEKRMTKILFKGRDSGSSLGVFPCLGLRTACASKKVRNRL